MTVAPAPRVSRKRKSDSPKTAKEATKKAKKKKKDVSHLYKFISVSLNVSLFPVLMSVVTLRIH
jgi:hypothetical protein